MSIAETNTKLWAGERMYAVIESGGKQHRVVEGETLKREDNGEDYGETRFASLGLIDGVPYTVIHTQRGDKTRLISAWKGGKRDYEKYKDSFP